MSKVATMTPVTGTDKISDVLARDESLVEVFVRNAPHLFSKLRNRAMRRVMGRLVTVEQAARTAQVPAKQLIHDLNVALGIADRETAPADFQAPAAAETETANREEKTKHHPETANVVELDVREDLRAGREPFSRIMSTVAALRPDDVLRVRTIFEPVPLFSVLGKRGFAHESLEHAADDWSVWFWRPDVEEAPERRSEETRVATTASDAAVDIAAHDDALTTWLDVRGLAPPEPMLRTLAALETLPPGHSLIQVNSRVPQFLLPLLDERGFTWRIEEQADHVLVRIHHSQEPLSEPPAEWPATHRGSPRLR